MVEEGGIVDDVFERHVSKELTEAEVEELTHNRPRYHTLDDSRFTVRQSDFVDWSEIL